MPYRHPVLVGFQHRLVMHPDDLAVAAMDAVFDAAAHRFHAVHALRQQHVLDDLSGVREAQAQGAVGAGQGPQPRLALLQDPQELAGAFHFHSVVDAAMR